MSVMLIMYLRRPDTYVKYDGTNLRESGHGTPTLVLKLRLNVVEGTRIYVNSSATFGL